MRTTEILKKELYLRARSMAADHLGLEDREIRRAEKSLARFFTTKWTQVKPSFFQKQIESADFIFWGDFHGVRQFQKSLLRYLKNQDSQRSYALALECLPSTAQKWVDLFLTGDLTEKEFLEKTKWVQIWGFPWAHYKPLFDWARDHKIKVLVVNAPGKKRSNLVREKWALKILKKFSKQNPGTQVFILFGEHHLLPGGFQRLLKNEKIKSLFVFQNSDVLYFKKSKTPMETVFRKGSNFCLQSVTPWVKWQSYNLYLESSSESQLNEEMDLTDTVLMLGKNLSQIFQMEFDGNSLEVFTLSDKSLWDRLKRCAPVQRALFEMLVEEDLSFFNPAEGWAYLSRVSVNEAAALAMQVLILQFNSKLRWNSNWNSVIWISAFSYFGSKLMNAHRKSLSLQDLQKRARVTSLKPLERQAARVAVQYSLNASLATGVLKDPVILSDSVRFKAAKWTAELLGEKIYKAYVQERLTLNHIKSFLKKDPQDPGFSAILQSLYEIVF